MGVVVTSSGAGKDITLVDAWESYNGLHMGASNVAQNQIIEFGNGVWPFGAIQMLPAVSGAVGSIAFDAGVFRNAHVWPSAAAITSQSSQQNFNVPFYKKNSLGTAPVAAVFDVPYKRYRVDYVARATAFAGGEIACGLSHSNPSSVCVGGATNPMVAWVSRAALNGGRWTPIWRITNGGAIVTGPDSGITNALMRQLSIIYEEGFALPRIRWLLDGQEVHQLAGDASMPDSIGVNPCALVKAVGAGVGTTAVFTETRYRCSLL